jgi:hypothetical protein
MIVCIVRQRKSTGSFLGVMRSKKTKATEENLGKNISYLKVLCDVFRTEKTVKILLKQARYSSFFILELGIRYTSLKH